jgi:hypothetical protein
MQDIFAVQDEVTHHIVSALQVKLTESEQQMLFQAAADGEYGSL